MKEEIVAYEEHADFDGSDIVISRQELVRCKDCRRWHEKNCEIWTDGIYDPDWFCADGERRL